MTMKGARSIKDLQNNMKRKLRESRQREREREMFTERKPIYKPPHQSHEQSKKPLDNPPISNIQGNDNELTNKINNLERRTRELEGIDYEKTEMLEPTRNPTQIVSREPVPQTEKMSMVGFGFICLFMTGVIAWIYKSDLYLRELFNEMTSKVPVSHGTIFICAGGLSIVIIIAGLSRRKRK